MERPVYVPSGRVGHEINYVEFHDVIDRSGCTLGDATDAIYRLATIRRTLKQCVQELPVAISMLN